MKQYTLWVKNQDIAKDLPGLEERLQALGIQVQRRNNEPLKSRSATILFEGNKTAIYKTLKEELNYTKEDLVIENVVKYTHRL
ncbi:MAG: hypothetical protein KC535_05310 [Nanoarchaeota archaeon]|nr:hypothetical protein [Nanoarchaeota archaeon]